MCISSGGAWLGKGFDFDTYGDRGYTLPKLTSGGVDGPVIESEGKDERDMEGEGVEGREYVALSSEKWTFFAILREVDDSERQEQYV